MKIKVMEKTTSVIGMVNPVSVQDFSGRIVIVENRHVRPNNTIDPIIFFKTLEQQARDLKKFYVKQEACDLKKLVEIQGEPFLNKALKVSVTCTHVPDEYKTGFSVNFLVKFMNEEIVNSCVSVRLLKERAQMMRNKLSDDNFMDVEICGHHFWMRREKESIAKIIKQLTKAEFDKNFKAAEGVKAPYFNVDAFWKGYRQGLQYNTFGTDYQDEAQHNLWREKAACRNDDETRFLGIGYCVGYSGMKFSKAHKYIELRSF
jgi:hypothetical protein